MPRSPDRGIRCVGMGNVLIVGCRCEADGSPASVRQFPLLMWIEPQCGEGAGSEPPGPFVARSDKTTCEKV